MKMELKIAIVKVLENGQEEPTGLALDYQNFLDGLVARVMEQYLAEATVFSRSFGQKDIERFVRNGVKQKFAEFASLTQRLK